MVNIRFLGQNHLVNVTEVSGRQHNMWENYTPAIQLEN